MTQVHNSTYSGLDQGDGPVVHGIVLPPLLDMTRVGAGLAEGALNVNRRAGSEDFADLAAAFVLTLADASRAPDDFLLAVAERLKDRLRGAAAS